MFSRGIVVRMVLWPDLMHYGVFQTVPFKPTNLLSLRDVKGPKVQNPWPTPFIHVFCFVGFSIFKNSPSRSLSLSLSLSLPLSLWIYTSSTAQGGGGSFKNRKPIGEIGCCESGMAERSPWWTERCLISLTLSLSFSDYLPAYQPIFYVSTYLSHYLSF